MALREFSRPIKKFQNKKYDLIIDIQGDEPLVSPYHITQ